MRKKTYPPLTEEQKQLVEDNMKLVPYTLEKCAWAVDACGDYEDAVADGYYSLIRAAIAYRPNQKVSFSTYACKAMCLQWAQRLQYRTKKKRYADKMPYSLDRKLKDDGEVDDMTLGDTIPGPLNVENAVNEKIVSAQVCRLAKEKLAKSSKNPDRDYDIWYSRSFGNYTTREKGNQYGLTNTRVCEIVKKVNTHIQSSMGGDWRL